MASASPAAQWSVSDLFAGQSPEVISRKVLDFFGGIASSAPEGEQVPEIPRVHGGLPAFDEESVTKLLKEVKSTNSTVDGDPLAHMLKQYPVQFLKPVAILFNEINESGRWPRRWKTEHLTIIPKVANPTDLSECRNISCTAALSKILEGRVLLKLRAELEPDLQQYGGIRGCSVEHMLVDLWEEVLESMENGSSAALLLGVDYEKAFNRMGHGECLSQLQRLGASPGSLSLVRSFLEERVMTIIIGNHRAQPIPIRRGSPQGSVLGCMLYCLTTQSLTKNIRAREHPQYFPQDDGGTDQEDINFWDRRPCKQPKAFMYVDDTTLFDNVLMEDAVRHCTTSATEESFENLALERDMETLKRRAEEIGMKINEKKTQLLVISPNNGCNTGAKLRAGQNAVIASAGTLKLVAFTFGSTPGAGAHVESIRNKFRRKVWLLYNLRRAGFKGRNLYRLYCCYLRSIIEYCSAVYHSLLGAGQAEVLEKLHRHAIRICYGFECRVERIMEENHIESLEERRVRRVDAFIRKALRSERFGARWFPQRVETPHNLRRRRHFQETRAMSLRRFRSPLAYMRRRANELGLLPGR